MKPANKRCLIFWHDLGEWEPLPNECVELQKCSRCPKTKTRKVRHTWESWRDFRRVENPEGRVTYQERKCGNCGLTQGNDL